MKQFLRHHSVAIGLFFLPWGVYFCWLWSRMFFQNSHGLFAGHPWVWADWGLHVALSSVFAYKPVSLWFDSYPLFSGSRLTYPFVTNLISGLMIRLGLGMSAAFIIPSLIFTSVSLGMLYYFFYRQFRSDLAAAGAASLFLCSGGLGFFSNLFTKGLIPSLFDSTLIHSAVSDAGIEVNNITASMIFPQRAFLLGLPIGVVIFHTLWTCFFQDHLIKRKSLWLTVAGVLAGLLPITHTHTFIVIVLASGWLFLFSHQKIKLWLWYGIPAVLVSGLVYLTFFYQNLSGGSFFSLNIGWYTHTGVLDWIIFWFKNWGAFGIGALIGTALLIRQKQKQIILVSFFWFLFLLANVVQFQPQVWDNTKIFAWVYFGLCLPFVYFLRELSKISHNRTLPCLMIGAIFSLAIISGFMDLMHNLDASNKTYRMLSVEQIELGEYVRDHLAPQAVILTADSVQNPIAMIAGRSVLLGYPGWMLNFSLPYQDRELDLPKMYQHPMQNTQLLDHYQITHILISSDEAQYDPGYFSPSAFQEIFSNRYGKLYRRL